MGYHHRGLLVSSKQILLGNDSWPASKTSMRHHAVLAYNHLLGHHTFDVLTEVMVDVHYKNNIQGKVARVTTDDGSNFVKAFVEFGTETDLLQDIPNPVANPGGAGCRRCGPGCEFRRCGSVVHFH